MSVMALLKSQRAERDKAISDEISYRQLHKERAPVEKMLPAGSDIPMASAPGFQRPVLPGHEGLERQSIGHRRYQILKDVREMARVDTRISRMLYKLAADSSYRGFNVVFEEGISKRLMVKAKDCINRTRYLIQDKKYLRGWMEALLRDGDLFLQLLVDGMSNEIVRAKKLAAEMTYSRLTPEGDFPKDKAPYYQCHVFDMENEIRSFDAWEIVHVKWRGEDGMPYGRPLFDSARLAYERVDSGEKNMALRRQFRSGRRLHFKVGTEENPATWDEVKEFKNENRDALENPQNPATDYFSNGIAEITEIQGDSTVGQTDDVKYFEGLMHIAGFTSQGQMSGGRETAANYAVIDSQDEDYIRTTGHIDETMEEGLCQIFDTGLLLRGILPHLVPYTLNWGAKDRYSLDKKLLRAGLIIEAGYSHETAYEVADLDNGMNYNDELERIRRQIREGVVPYEGPAVSRGHASAKKEHEDNLRLGDGKGS